MMKKFLLAAVLAATLAPAASAQENEITYGVRAGVGVSSFIGSDADNDYCDEKFAYMVGVDVNYSLKRNWGLRSGLSLYGIGCDMKENIINAIGAKSRMIYLEIPLRATFRVGNSEKFSAIFSAGPSFAVGVGGKTEVNVFDASEKVNTFGDDTDTRRCELGFGVGVDFKFHRFTVGVDERFGLTKFAPDVNAHNYSCIISVGYLF